MKNSSSPAKTVKEWLAIPPRIRRATSGLSARQLGWRGGSARWSIREYVHHLVEANIIASTIVLAALGKPGCRFDWSWMFPDARWMKGLRYARAPIEPAIRVLEALCSHVSGLVTSAPAGLNRHVRLIGTAGGRSSRQTVRQILDEEVAHARLHLKDVSDTKKAHRRSRSGRGST